MERLLLFKYEEVRVGTSTGEKEKLNKRTSVLRLNPKLIFWLKEHQISHFPFSTLFGT